MKEHLKTVAKWIYRYLCRSVPQRELHDALGDGQSVHLIGGADVAAELVDAIRQRTELAAGLMTLPDLHCHSTHSDGSLSVESFCVVPASTTSMRWR